MQRLIDVTLKSVGEGEPFYFQQEYARITIQMRKLLSMSEIALLPQDKLPPMWRDHGVLIDG
ncbi:MAG: hypothetical protein WBG86_14530 [Polyangiales bacterium]